LQNAGLVNKTAFNPLQSLHFMVAADGARRFHPYTTVNKAALIKGK
jgi:hypothetical protein